MTVKILETLRLEGTLETDISLYLEENIKKEFGRLSLVLRHKSHDIVA